LEYPIHVHDINVKDPQILADPVSNKYYMYAKKFDCGVTPTERKGTGATFYAICSEDLVTWSNPILVFEQNDFWASEDYMSPAGFYHNGKYYIIAGFSAPGRLRRLQALVSDSPLGPFVPAGEPLSPPAWQCMDGTLYTDKKGGLWLVFAHDWVQVYDGQIAAIRVEDDLSKSIGNPMVLFRGSDAPWGDDFVWSSDEGGGAARCPWPYRMSDGSLVMIWQNSTPYGYAIGIARSETGEICGPWKQFDKPTYALDGAHGTLFNRLQDGMLMMTCYNPGRKGVNGITPGLKTLMFEMEEVYYGLIEVVNEFTGCWWMVSGGHALPYRTPAPLTDIPTYSKLQNYAGPFGNRRIKWAMAPETKYFKGKITERD